jgi:hypothetical protein
MKHFNWSRAMLEKMGFMAAHEWRLDDLRRTFNTKLEQIADLQEGGLQRAFETIDGKIVAVQQDSSLRGAGVRGI